MGKYTVNYCKTNKVAILVENQEQIDKLKKLNCVGYIPSNPEKYFPFGTMPHNNTWNTQGFPEKSANYEHIKFQTFIEDNIETIPEKYIVECKTKEETNVVSQYIKESKCIHPHYKYVVNHKGILGNYYKHNNLWDTIPNKCEELTILTFEQFKEKILNMNTEKKVIGWKLKEDCKQYEKAAVEVCKQNESKEIEDFKVSDGISFGINAVCIDWLKKAGVLELWFEKVYKEEYKVGDYVSFYSELNKKTYTSKIKEWTSSSYCTLENGLEPFKHLLRKATQEEIKASQQKVIFVGGKFDVTLKDGKIYHKSDDITQFVELLIKSNNIVGTSSIYGKFSATISDIVFSKTGCQNVETRLSDWAEVYKQFQELNK